MKIIFLALILFTTSAFANSVDIFSHMAKLPKITQAKIKRGSTEIPVDLTQKSQIKDYDVLILDEGVYSTLGDFTAKYVRVIGKGRGKTFISSTKDSSPIPVNSTEFWDVTIADAQFKITDVSGLWAVNVEFAGATLVRPAAMDKSPAFAIRSIFSNYTNSDLKTDDTNLYTVLKIEDESPAGLLSYEDELDRDNSMILKERLAHKGLVARGANYLYQMKNLKPQYDQAKYSQLTKQAKAAKAKGHLYVSMLSWAEADRLSGHARFDEVLKEIAPLNQNVSQECGCTVEGQGLASNVKKDLEQNLYAKLPITGLPGKCKIQTLLVNKGTTIASARLQAQLDQAASFQARESAFQESMIAHSGNPGTLYEAEFAVGAPAAVPSKEYTVVADVEMPGLKKTFSKENGNVNEPLTTSLANKFAAAIKRAKAKIASSDLVAKVDGLIVSALYGSDPARQNEYESLHEQQFGRKASASAATSSVFAY
ncbi:MAG: hypothetical protein V4598_05695 [Bdellovibrionota bacterium]